MRQQWDDLRPVAVVLNRKRLKSIEHQAQRDLLCAVVAAAQAASHDFLNKPMHSEGTRAAGLRLGVVDQRQAGKAPVMPCRDVSSLIVFRGDDVERDALRREERGDPHQRLGLGTGLHRLGDGQVKSGEEVAG